MDDKWGKSSLWKYVAVGVIGVLLLVVLVYTVFHLLHTSPPIARKAKQPIPVPVRRAAVMDLVETVGATTITVPFAEFQVRTEVSGSIKKFLVKIGDPVSPGTQLAYLEDKEYQATLRQAESEKKSAVEQVRVAKLNLSRYDALYREKVIALSELEKYQVALAEAQATLGKADKNVVLAKRQLAVTKIISNIHGVVSSQIAHEGEFVDRNAPILNLGQVTPILAQAKVPEEKVSSVSLNQEGQVTFDAFPGQTFTGKIYKIDPNTDPNTRVFPVFIELGNADQALSLGLTGYARLERQVKALAVPSVAIFDMYSKPTVLVVKDNVVSFRHIVVGGVVSGYTWIKTGLNQGDIVVVAGQRYLKEGDRVKEGHDEK
jgi:RND family efflux transporter MFP subunit